MYIHTHVWIQEVHNKFHQVHIKQAKQDRTEFLLCIPTSTYLHMYQQHTYAYWQELSSLWLLFIFVLQSSDGTDSCSKSKILQADSFFTFAHVSYTCSWWYMYHMYCMFGQVCLHSSTVIATKIEILKKYFRESSPDISTHVCWEEFDMSVSFAKLKRFLTSR